jgi:phage N-6-adenine-methyltransferase
MDIRIDPEFLSLIPPLSPEEFAGLESQIIADGVRDPLVVWNQGTYAILVDGHNRKDIADRNGITYQTYSKQFVDRREARIWIRNNQMSRRNLNLAVLIDLQRQNKAEMLEVGREKQVETLKRGDEYPVLSTVDRTEPHSTRESMAKAAGTSVGTVARAEVVADRAPELWEKCKAGEVTIGAAYAEVTQPKAHVSNNSGDNEWYTPQEIIEAARKVLITIDLDPASSEVANTIVRATTFYAAEDNGLSHPWRGHIFMNPPYAQPLIGQFCEKICEEFDAGGISAIVLTNNATETAWFQTLSSRAAAICFPRSRIRFWSPGKTNASPLQGQAIFYFDGSLELEGEGFDGIGRFGEAFGEIGQVWYAE